MVGTLQHLMRLPGVMAGRCSDFDRLLSDPVTTPVKISFEEIIMRLPFPTDEVNIWITAMRTLQSETVSEFDGQMHFQDVSVESDPDYEEFAANEAGDPGLQMLLNDENRKKYGITEDEAATLKSVLFRCKGKGTLEQWLRILWSIRELE